MTTGRINQTQPMSSPIIEIQEEGYKISRSENSVIIKNNFKDTPKKSRQNPANLMSVSIFNDLRKQAYDYPEPSKEEIDDYIGEPVAKSTINVLDWWSSNIHRYPKLSMMAKDFFSHQSTSVPSEIVFSGAVEMLTKKRNRI
ncbi:unnamed protein product [Gordionus sp. m RMFG-2023]